MGEAADEKFEEDVFFGVGVPDGFEEVYDVDGDAEFFADFAEEALFKGFGGFAFAAGEFPEAAEVGAGLAPGEEDAAAAKNEGGGDFHDGKMKLAIFRGRIASQAHETRGR